jgi:hypothetical protein
MELMITVEVYKDGLFVSGGMDYPFDQYKFVQGLRDRFVPNQNFGKYGGLNMTDEEIEALKQDCEGTNV